MISAALVPVFCYAYVENTKEYVPVRNIILKSLPTSFSSIIRFNDAPCVAVSAL